MIRQCFLTRTGIQFEAEKLREVGLDPMELYPVVRPRGPPLPPVQGIERSYSTSKTLVQADGGEGARGDGGDSDGEEDEDFLGEEEEERRDAVCEMYDQLKLSWAWWILELLPMRERVQDAFGNWTKHLACVCSLPLLYLLLSFCVFVDFSALRVAVAGADASVDRMNWGRPRVVPGQEMTGIKVHRSVKMRMEHPDLNYTPAVKFDVEPTWVD